MSIQGNPYTIHDSSLVLHLDAANPKSYIGSGTNWADLSGNAYDGTLVNGPTFNTSNCGTIQFDGIDDYINGVHNSTVSVTGDMTAEAWFKFDYAPSGDWVRIFGKGDVSNRTFGLWGYYDSNGTGYLLYQRYGTTTVNLQHSLTFTMNTWYCATGVSVGTYHSLYLNGKFIIDGNAGSTFYSSTNTYTLGYAGFHTYIHGYIASVKLYNRGITAYEVLQNYNATRTRFGL